MYFREIHCINSTQMRSSNNEIDFDYKLFVNFKCLNCILRLKLPNDEMCFREKKKEKGKMLLLKVAVQEYAERTEF